MELDKVTLETFEPHIESKFALSGENEHLTLILESVTLTGSGSPVRPRGFSLIFRPDSVDPFPQRTYELSHDDLGTFSLFLVPIQVAGKGVRYEAIFN